MQTVKYLSNMGQMLLDNLCYRESSHKLFFQWEISQSQFQYVLHFFTSHIYFWRNGF